MKKYIAVLLAAAMIVSVSSCTQDSPKGAQPSGMSSADTAAASPSAVSSAALEAVRQLLDGEPTAGQLGQYLQQHARELPAEANDLLLERLLLLQLDVSMEMNFKILKDSYLSALNDSMGGVLDPTKLGNIKDATIRGDFQTMFDGMMTVVRYEETPAVETNWSALNRLKDAFSPQTAFLIEYGTRQQGNYYSDPAKGLDLMAADIAAVEKEFPKVSAGFVRWQMHLLYQREIASLLFGPEGEYLSELTSGKKAVIDRLAKYADAYKDTRFGAVCMSLLNMQAEDQQTLIDTISASTVFTPDDPRTLEIAAPTENGFTLRIPRIVEKSNSPLTQKLNKIIDDAAHALLEAGSPKQLYSTTAVSGNYLSVMLSYSYADKNGKNGYTEKDLVLDLTTGKNVTLDDISGKDFNTYKSALLKAMRGSNVPLDLTPPVSFVLDSAGIQVQVPSKLGYPDSCSVTLNGLRAFLDVSKLY